MNRYFTAGRKKESTSGAATTLRKDSGQLAAGMEQMYQRALSEARVANAGEGKPRIYNIVSESRFVRSRRRSTNG